MMQKVQKTPLIHQLFEQQSLQTPDAIAVVFKDEQLTYRQLNEKANQVAHYLKSLNVGPEVRVGVCLERSPLMLIVLLGILKAGGAYVPLDHTHPTERNDYVLEDAEISLLLTQKHLLCCSVSDLTQVICLDQNVFSQFPQNNLLTASQADQLAYIIYTSGSTGKPKGVEIIHATVVNLLTAIESTPGFTSEDRLVAVTTICFDTSVCDLFLPLAVGARVIIAPQEVVIDGIQLAELLHTSGATVMQATPATWQMLRQSGWQGNPQLNIWSTGEALPRHLADWLLTQGASVWNLYGPTETTVWATCCQVHPGNRLISIGRPIANTQIYLLDQQLQPVAEGEIGELYIGGAGLARGYLNRSELTAERFIQYPVSPNKTERIYKTGDLARYLPDGNLECLGRIDHQVKIRGFRIELGEIESLLWQHQDIESAVVVATEDGLGHKRLVAYVVSDVISDQLRDQSTLQGSLVKSLRGYLQQHLPDYMVPAHFVILDALPLNSNGKVDRNALPSPEQYAPSTSDKLVKPKTTTEEKLTQLWEEILRLKQVSIDDNFYTLGGDSLLAIRLISQINQRFGIELPLASFLVSPTIREIAVAIETLEQSDLDSTSPLIPDLEKASILDPTILPNLVAIETIPNIFLTGSTGFLGIYLLYELLQQTSADCYCLVRADSLEAARDKIQQQLKHYQLWENQFDTRIIPILGDLSQPQFGLRSEQFDRLAQKIDVIYHCGAWVNILYPYTALAPTNVTGTQEVLRLASQIKIKPVHFISTVDVFASNQQLQIRTVGEQDPIGSGLQLLSGYAQSKYVAERLVMTAHERGIPTAIYRPSNIMGASNTGICSASSFVTKMIQGCIEMGMAPALSAALNLVPVDYASQAIIHLSLTQPLQGQAFHIVNQSPLIWKDLVSFIHQQGHSLDWVSYEAWYAALRHQVLQTNSEQTLMSLVTLFENRPLIQKSLGAFYFKSDRVLDGLVNTGITCPAPNEKLLMSYLADLTAKNTFGGIHLNQPLVLPSYSQSMTPIMGVIS
ncbi:MAG: amino acid adenylation domain-containing protein [Microcoleaceae cyanobacterium]